MLEKSQGRKLEVRVAVDTGDDSDKKLFANSTTAHTFRVAWNEIAAVDRKKSAAKGTKEARKNHIGTFRTNATS